jgi:hypothetical protein
MLENRETAGLAGHGGFGMQIVVTSIAYPKNPEIATFNLVDLRAERVRRIARVSAPVARLIAHHAFWTGGSR